MPRAPGDPATIDHRPGLTHDSSFARSLQAHPQPAARLRRGAALAVELVDGCDHAGVTLASAVAVEAGAASDDVVLRGDAWQYELSEGPCLDAVRLEHTVISQDLALDPRWSTWAPRVRAELGVRAMLSLPLALDHVVLGALNLYADRTEVWTGDAVAVAHGLADQLAAALADASQIEHLGRAVAGRTVVGQAQGILMERLDLDPDQAFAYLRRVSQSRHLKLLVAAEELVATRQLPLVEDVRPDPRPGGRTSG